MMMLMMMMILTPFSAYLNLMDKSILESCTSYFSSYNSIVHESWSSWFLVFMTSQWLWYWNDKMKYHYETHGPWTILMSGPRVPSILPRLLRYRRGLDDIHRMGIDSFFLECRRTNDITWQNYMIAGVDDVVKDLQWESWQLWSVSR